MLQREGHAIPRWRTGARASCEEIVPHRRAAGGAGPELPDLDLPEAIRRVRGLRAGPRTSRSWSCCPRRSRPRLETTSTAAGANAVMRRPLDPRSSRPGSRSSSRWPGGWRRASPCRARWWGRRATGRRPLLRPLPQPQRQRACCWPARVRLADGPGPRAGVRPARRGRPACARWAAWCGEAGEVGWPYIGYGVEFLYLPAAELRRDRGPGGARRAAPLPRRPRTPATGSIPRCGGRPGSTRSASPSGATTRWHAEIRRAPREAWRPGEAGPFYVVEGPSPEKALREAREFLVRHG